MNEKEKTKQRFSLLPYKSPTRYRFCRDDGGKRLLSRSGYSVNTSEDLREQEGVFV